MPQQDPKKSDSSLTRAARVFFLILTPALVAPQIKPVYLRFFGIVGGAAAIQVLLTDNAYATPAPSDSPSPSPSGSATPTPTPSPIPPAAVSDLAVVAGSLSSSVDVTWTSTGEDNNTGNLTGTFRLFYSANAADMTGLTATTAQTSSLKRVDVAASNVSPGTSRFLTITSLSASTVYHVRLFTLDAQGLWSAISNSASGTSSAGGSITAAGNGNWFSTNINAPWPNGQVPASGDTATIPTGVTVTVDGAATAAGVTIDGAIVLNADAGDVSFTVGSGGFTNNGSFTVTDSGADSVASLIGPTGGFPPVFQGNGVVFAASAPTLRLIGIDYRPTLSLTSAGHRVDQGGANIFNAITMTNGTLTQGAYDMSVKGAVSISGGTFSKSTTGHKLKLLGDFTLGAAGQNLGHLVIGASPDTITLTSDLTADSLVINSGDIFQTNGYEVTLTTDVVNNGELDARNIYSSPETDDSVISLGGNWTGAYASTFTAAGSTVTFTATSGTKNISAGGHPFKHFRINGTGGTFELADSLYVDGTMSVGAGTFSSSASNFGVTAFDFDQTAGTVNLNSSTMTVAGNFRVAAGTFGNFASTVTFNATGPRSIAGLVASRVVFDGVGGTWTLSNSFTSGPITINNGTVDTGSNQSVGLFFSNPYPHFVMNGGAFNANASSILAGGAWTINGGTFNAGTSTVSFQSNASHAIKSNGNAFYNLHFLHSLGSWTLSDPATVNGLLTLSTGTINTAGHGLTAGAVVITSGTVNLSSTSVSVGGNWSMGNPSVINFNAGTSTVAFTAAGTQTLAGSTTFYAMRKLTAGATLQFVAGTTQTVTNAVDFKNIHLRSNSDGSEWNFKYSGSSQTLVNLSVKDSNASSGSMMVSLGSVDGGNNTNWLFSDPGVRYWVGNSLFSTATNWSYGSGGAGNATVPTSTMTVVFDGGSVSASVVDGGFAGTVATMTVTTSYTGTIALARSLTVSETLSISSGTLASSSRALTAGRVAMSGGVYSVTTGTAIINGDFTQTGGGFTAPSTTLQVGGSFLRSGGTFSHNSGSVTITGAGIHALSGSTTFYALRALTPGATLQFTAGTTQYATSMVEFRDVALKSTSDGSQWHFNYSGSSQTLANVTVRDSNASSGTLMQATGGSADSGNNVNWAFGFPPSAVTDLAATAAAFASLRLNWSAPGDNAGADPITGTYRIFYSSISADMSGLSATTSATGTLNRLDVATTTVTPGTPQTRSVTGLLGMGTTYYFRIYTADTEANWSAISNGATAYTLREFNGAAVNVNGPGGGLRRGETQWGDLDGDGDLDVVTAGQIAGIESLRVHWNNGNGTFDQTELDVDGVNGGLTNAAVTLGDVDNDGDLDIVANGNDAGNIAQLRLYKNNGNGTFDANQTEIDGDGGGMSYGDVDLGDFDNDGDLDLLAIGWDNGGVYYQLRVYRNAGNGNFDNQQIEVDGAGGGLYYAQAMFADYDNDGDLDITALGQAMSGFNQIRIYKNNGNGSFDPTQIEVDSLNGGLQEGRIAWGDFDNDGDIDLLAAGRAASLRELRVYRNNGNGTMDATQIDVDGSGGGLYFGAVAWGDFDNDGDLDIGVTGDDASNQSQIRVYRNNGDGSFDANQIEVNGLNGGAGEAVAWGDFDNDGDLDLLESGWDELVVHVSNIATLTPNTVPSAPAGLTNAAAANGVEFRWNAGSDGAFDADSLYYQIRVGTATGGQSIVTKAIAAPLTGNYLRPKLSSSQLGVRLSLAADTTYYWAVRTIDASLAPSVWSTEASTYVPTQMPGTISDVTVSSGSQVSLSWTVPYPVPGSYDIRFSTTAAITNLTEFNAATPLGGGTTANPSPFSSGRQTLSITGLMPDTTHYFAIRSMSGAFTSPIDTTAVEPSAIAGLYSEPELVGTQSEGVHLGNASFGDFDGDGDDDLLVIGREGSSGLRNLNVYRNDGGSFNPNEIAIEATGNGLSNAWAAWGDFDNDGDLDVAAMGNDSSSLRQLRVYRNNGDSTFDSNQIEVDGANGGLADGSVQWGDFDNDGDLDLLAMGQDGSNARQLRVYRNNGNGTFDQNQIEVESAGNGLYLGSASWGDFDNDGDLDILALGQEAANRQLRVYRNNGDGSFDPSQIDVDSLNGGLTRGSASWADFDNDGDLDILAMGFNGTNRQIRVYKNNGNGTFDSNEIVLASTAGLHEGSIVTGDVDNDGDLDVVVNGWLLNPAGEIRIYRNNGAGGFDTSMIRIDGGMGLGYGTVALSDFDADGDLDIGIMGLDEAYRRSVHVYRNNYSAKTVNSAPSAPSGFSSAWNYGVSRSTFTLKWDSGANDGANSANSLYYNVWLSSNVTAGTPPATGYKSMIAPRYGTPKLGNYLRAPNKTWPNDGGAKHGVVYSSAPNTGSNGLVTDASYYWRVQTIDAGLRASAWSPQQVVRTDVAPDAATVAPVPAETPSMIEVHWTMPGDDGATGTINGGTTRIFLSTVAADINTVAATDPATATRKRVDLAESGFSAPGVARYTTVPYLIRGATYYVALFTSDEQPNWSARSNVATSPAQTGNLSFFTGGSGNWHSTTVNAPWNNGLVPTAGDTVEIGAGHVVTTTATVQVASMAVVASGGLVLDGTFQPVTFTIGAGGKLTNGGFVTVSDMTNPVTLRGASPGVIFQGTDIDFAGRKIFLGNLDYRPSMAIGSGETVELSGPLTLGPLTTSAGAGFIMGANNDLTLTGDTTLAPGTFTPSTGSGKVKLNGNLSLSSGNQPLGHVVTGP